MPTKKRTAKKNKREETSENSEVEDTKKENLSMIAIAIIFILIVAIVVVFITMKPKPESSCDSLTIEEKFQKTIAGEEDDCYYNYNGFSFVKHDDLWIFQVRRAESIQPWRMALHYGPRQLGDVPVEGDIKDFIRMTTDDYGFLYLTFDPEGNNLSYVALSTSELVANWAGPLEIKHILACTRNTDPVCEELTIISCEEASQPTVYLKESPEAKISRQGMCLTVQGPREGLLKSANKLAYLWYGIMD